MIGLPWPEWLESLEFDRDSDLGKMAVLIGDNAIGEPIGDTEPGASPPFRKGIGWSVGVPSLLLLGGDLCGESIGEAATDVSVIGFEPGLCLRGDR